MTERVTPDDIQGLRVETARLADSIDGLASKSEVKEQLGHKADTSKVKELKRLADRANINSFVACAAVALVLVLGGVFWKAQASQHAKDARTTHDRRVADCVAVGDFGQMVKDGATAVAVPTDPVAKQRYDDFIYAYNAKIDEAVVQIRAKKGYSADCSVIGNPP